MVARGARFFLGALFVALSAPTLAGETATYSYDALGRLVATTSSAGPGSTIAYDAAGNRTVYNVSLGGGAGLPSVVDGSFEVPEAGNGYLNTPTVSGLAWSGWSGITGNGAAWGYSPAPDGDQAAFLDSGPNGASSLSMAVSGLTPGASYTVSFQLAGRPGYTRLQIGVSFEAASLGTYQPVADNLYHGFTTPTFTASAASGSLRFASLSYGDAALDQVVITRVQP